MSRNAAQVCTRLPAKSSFQPSAEASACKSGLSVQSGLETVSAALLERNPRRRFHSWLTNL
jgi:hypothetical protein